ncbi:YdcF family protein [Pseudomonas guariconensis]|uniref:YdcF family protein n=1 Tax=Pseudomonas TaxID=286 RepID=UPI0020985948|nr:MULTISPECIES: YdcF family protein [Pseudomonas]MCO7641341.1 YdcF family protein [Pseudomonas sp. S 311-6]MCO7513301.1 YdcF family protein [Pseudomonas putida]MCO7566555.1 YdcF family protein [Pseudomonas mosselii]MCO7596716.1 YdcF family protein [Pseudomonas guariconensis]MCO7605747.1 YdcF family protein [Pseudomonas guariconensis]
MPIRFFIKQWLLPPGLLFLSLLLAWWLRKRYPGLAAVGFVVGLGGLWLMSLPLVVEQLARQLETEPPLAQADWATLADRADAIVVLGAGRERGDPAWGGEDQPSALALERMRYAAALTKASGLSVLISGGLHYGTPPSEAQLMTDRLREDFAVQVRWKEEASRTTWENAQLSAELLLPKGVRRVVVVTHAWHMQRARWCFEQAGFEVVPAPMGFLGRDTGQPFGGWLPESRALWQSGQLLNEVAGLIGYRLFYRDGRS